MRGFLEARCLWEPGSSLFSLFGLLPKVSGVNVRCLSHKNPQTDTFLRDFGLAKLRSTAWVWNHQGISKLVNRLIVACLMTASLRFPQSNSAGLPCYNTLCSGIFNVPLPYGMCLKVSHKGRHIFEQLRPQQHRSAMDKTRDSRGQSLSVPFLRLSGSGA